jgi:hypothetical protein
MMFLDFFKKKPKTVVIRDDTTQKITDLLFPPLRLGESSKGFYQVDYSVDMNLESALEDLKDGKNDKVSQDTISYVLRQLIEVRKLLNAYPELDERSSYLLVDCLPDPKNEIEAEGD